MKTPLNRTATWLVAVMTVLTGGCVEPKNTGADAATNAPADSVVAAVETVATNAESEVVELPELTDPPQLRSARTARTYPEEITKVIELVEAGAGEEVARAFVERSTIPYELSLDDVLYLRDIGVPDGVVAAMMRRGAELRQQQVDMAVLQTNLVAVVEDLKAALGQGAEAGVAGAEGTANGLANGYADNGTGMPPAPGTAVAGQAAGPAPLPQAGTAVPADAPAEVQPFYESLSPYGSWYQVPSYGWIWQPSVVVVNSGWQPYRHGGRWVWSDWGWYWSSEYSWGWAPFHYGRWCTYPGLGWCWVPGTVWGPSWVTWRSHGGYVGWAPLPPPCGWSPGLGLTWYGRQVSLSFGFGLAPSWYTFVSYGNFCHRNVSHHALRHDRVTAVYNNSTVVNNVINGNNNTIINNGVGYETVASRTRSEIPKARVEPLPDNVDSPVRVDRIERGRDGLVVYRPTPVSEVGGKPTALRAEARPSVASAGLVSGVPSRGTAGGAGPAATVPAGRAAPGPRMAGTPGVSTPKAVDSRGIPGRSQPSAVGVPNASTPSSLRPTPGSIANPAAARPSVRNAVGSVPKAVEGRAGVPQSRSAAPYTGSAGSVGAPSPGTALGPTRQTTPVPLADPSRYLPRGSVPAPRGATPAITPKSAYEGRGGVVAPSAPTAPTAPVAGGYAPVYRGSTTPRMAVPQTAPKVDPSRGGVGGGYSPAPMRAPAAAPVRPGYSVPSGGLVRPGSSVAAPAARVPAVTPRTSYSSPAPAMRVPAAPRPSYSAPAPRMSAPAAPRPSVAAPAPAGPSPSGGRGGSGRTQQN